MAGKKGSSRGRGKGKDSQNAVPDIYQEMLAEALPDQPEIPERPLKRRRTGKREDVASGKTHDSDEDEDEDMQFEDVLGNGEGSENGSMLAKRQQTAYRDSDEESDDSDFNLDNFDFDTVPAADAPSGDLELTLVKKPVPQAITPRRKAVTKADKEDRLLKHKMHVLCLVSALDRANDWCNDAEVQGSLKPLLTMKMLTFLRPKSSLSQFGRADSVKRGLDDVAILWRTKFEITARGFRRALWADDDKDLQNARPDANQAFTKSQFREAAKSLKGTRDVGAQLFCALLRSAHVETRLVCSLQPLSFTAGGPSMPKYTALAPKRTSPESRTEDAMDRLAIGSSALSSLPFSPRRRLGHPNAADYHMPEMSAPPRPPPRPKPIALNESPYPVFWVEVFDEAHQKWFPVDPLVTETIAKPLKFEPPAADRENNMSYVLAFEEDGSARDVTRRYAKAYNAKARRNRVESTHGGERWWRRTMRPYARGFQTDADQIEDTELAAAEAKEPMPKNIADFKDHPYYALERHLRRNEILLPTRREIGKVAAGRDASTPGGKKLEPIFRRRDVKIAKSADAWYRLGKEVKMGEQPVKTVAAKRRPDDEDDGGDELDERAGTNLYTEDQTELYEAPPIVNGRVPKNSYGNLDIYVPSMVPKGGVHIPHDEASRAARILAIDYSDALTGFSFHGRHGTAVLKGVVVATEYQEAVLAVIEGFRDEQAQLEETMRANAALRMWKRFLVGLRIKERVDGYAEEGEMADYGRGEVLVSGDEDGDEDSDEYVDDGGGGGFFPE